MKCVSVVVIVVFLAVLVHEFEAYCKFESKGDDELCVTPVGTLSVGESAESYVKCEKYVCESTFLNVCGIGYNDGPMDVSECVQQKLDKCCYQFVNASDSSKICLEKICPEYLSQ